MRAKTFSTGRRCRGGTFLLLLTIAGPLPADVIVDVQDALITANGTGFVNVLISSNAIPRRRTTWISLLMNS